MPTPTLLDVTLRDGGYVNRHSWSLEQAVGIVNACAQAGIEHVEVGYYRPGRHRVDGDVAPAASCPPYYLERLRELLPHTAVLTVMAHVADVPSADYRDLAAMGVGLVRLPAKISSIGGVVPHVAAVRGAGMRVAVNLIRVSEVHVDDVTRAARAVVQAGADVFYVADSNASLFPDQVARIVRAVRQGAATTAIGFHAHDGLSLAFGNCLAAVQEGCEYLDASLGGMGKGGGNLSMELIAGYLRCRAGRPYDIEVLTRTRADVLAPWAGTDPLVACESIVSGLLDLNIDEIAVVRDSTPGGLLTLLDTAPVMSYDGLSQLVRPRTAHSSAPLSTS
jgi:4-hydroxy 2-oxovalerate aldolase